MILVFTADADATAAAAAVSVHIGGQVSVVGVIESTGVLRGMQLAREVEAVEAGGEELELVG